jgi:aspartyl protease family protein
LIALMRRSTAALLMLCMAPWAAAQSVTLSGSLGASKALLVIDGEPYTVSVGASAKGVLLKRLGDGEAEVSVGGRSTLLRLGAPVRVGGGAGMANAPREIVLTAGPGGHFASAGTINGKTVQFMVDTGATSIAMSQSEANRIGLDWQRGRRALTQTAGGVVPIHAVNLSSVQVGGIEVINVDAVILPTDMPMVLLGNSFLSRFSMRRDNDVMRLEKR